MTHERQDPPKTPSADFKPALDVSIETARFEGVPRPPLDFRQLRVSVSLARVLELLNWQSVSAHGSQLRGPCPIHGASSPQSRSFSANLERNVWKCFGCGKGGNQMDLWMAVTNLPFYEAALDLCQKAAIDPPTRHL